MESHPWNGLKFFLLVYIFPNASPTKLTRLFVICYLSHTRQGSLKTFVYEGVRDTSLSNESVIDIGELVNADIVLTTYDVLKEDLSHDSDRHEGDRRFMRFQKRFFQSL